MTTRTIAFHEAGHAVALATRNIPIERCSIRQTRESGGHVKPADLKSLELHDVLIFLLAGGAAERCATGAAPRFDGDDREQAALIAATRLRAAEDAPAVRDCLARYDAIATALMLTEWPWVARTAAALEWWTELDGWDVANLR